MLDQLLWAVHRTRAFHRMCSSQGRCGLGAGLLHPWEGLGALGRWPPVDPPQTLPCSLSTESGAPVLLPYQFRMEEIEGFRYRCRVSGVCGRVGGESPLLGPCH